MSSDLDELARRLVACPQFRWMPRMRACVHLPARTDHYCVVRKLDDGRWLCEPEDGAAYGRKRWPREMGAPDLTDPATVGCLEAMVEGFAECSRARLGGWVIYAPVGDGPGDGGHWIRPVGMGETKGEAIARALLQQWGAS